MRSSWSSFVAVGDSFTEGLDDLRPDGSPRGWADLVAARLAARTPGFRYANLAVRGRCLDPVVDEQVPVAAAMRPDLVSIAAGGNDVLRPRFDVDALGARMAEALRTLSATGATVLVFTGFDPSPRLPFGQRLGSRARAYNAAVREAAAASDALLIDMWAMIELAWPEMWSIDRLHLSSDGHRHVAGAVLSALGLTPDGPWPAEPLPVPSPSRVAARAADLAWSREYLLPWVVRRLRGRSAGDNVPAKRAALEPWEPEDPEQSEQSEQAEELKQPGQPGQSDEPERNAALH